MLCLIIQTTTLKPLAPVGANTVKQAQSCPHPDYPVTDIDLPPTMAEASGGREGVMVVVPGLPKGGYGEDGNIAAAVMSFV
jgi:hypothetical protein